MGKSKNMPSWTEVGYDLFAHEGPEGIQVERLARMLGLNKSGFYHYFGDLDGYYGALLELHEQQLELYLNDVRGAGTIDPDYIHILIKFKTPTMFQMQLERLKNNPRFRKVAEHVDQKEEEAIRQLWNKYLGTESSPDLAMRYFLIVRDVFYSRINFQNYTFEEIQKLLEEARDVLHGVREVKPDSEQQSWLTG